MGIDIMSEIAWAITRNNSAFLLKKRNCPKPFSTDPMNLTNKHSLRYTGLVNKKAVAVAPAADNKGFTVTIKGGKTSKIATSKNTVTMKSGPRRSLHKAKAMIVKQISQGPRQGCHETRCNYCQVSKAPSTTQRKQNCSQEVRLNVKFNL